MMLEWFRSHTFLKILDRYSPFPFISFIRKITGQEKRLASNSSSSYISMQINLSYSSVTDVGLLSLASISCLQSMTILHLKGLTASGLAAALLACGGLTKVKLQASFKSLLPQPLFEHLEARGCMFQWRDKVFQVYLICLFSFFPPMKQ